MVGSGERAFNEGDACPDMGHCVHALVLTPLSLCLAYAGFGILVSTRAKPTRARYTVRDPASVLAFLTRVVEWGKTTGNGWHAKPSCNGWCAERL